MAIGNAGRRGKKYAQLAVGMLVSATASTALMKQQKNQKKTSHDESTTLRYNKNSYVKHHYRHRA